MLQSLQLNIKKGEEKMNGKIIETRDLTYELYGILADYFIDNNNLLLWILTIAMQIFKILKNGKYYCT